MAPIQQERSFPFRVPEEHTCLRSGLPLLRAGKEEEALGGSHTLISSTWADQPWKQQAELTLTRRACDMGGCFSIPTSRNELHSARTEQMPRARRVGSCLEQHHQSCRNLTQRSSPDVLKLETQNQGVGRVTCLLEL